MEYNIQGEDSVKSVFSEPPPDQAIHMFSKYECREKDLIFEREELIGVGSYGKVYKAFYKKGAIENNSSPFALKQLLVENPTKEGFPVSALREIRILKKIKHKNVANLIEIIQQKPKVQDYNGPGKDQIL
jgi:serine/threonine protein kinase